MASQRLCIAAAITYGYFQSSGTIDGIVVVNVPMKWVDKKLNIDLDFMLEESLKYLEEKKQEKYKTLVEDVKEYIEEHYATPNQYRMSYKTEKI